MDVRVERGGLAAAREHLAAGEEPPRDAAERVQVRTQIGRGAERRLGEGEPRGAFSEEQQAAEQLGGLREQIGKARRPQRAETRMDNERVAIPGADDYRAPREFREELMDAMKRPAPEGYQERVKKFYEEIAR